MALQETFERDETMAETRILIVEDESIVAQGVATMLTRSGYVVAAIASSGEQAIQQATETRPDLVLMDIKLEGEIDGIEAADKICAYLDVPVVYLTAYTDDEILERTKVTQPFGYIVKPCEDRELYSTIEMALYKHKMEKKLKESEARYRAISELTSDLHYTLCVEPNGALEAEWVTDAFVRTTGFTLEEIAARDDWIEMIHPDDASIAYRHMQTLVSGQSQVCEFRIVTKGGEVRWLRNHGQPVWDEAQDRVVRIIGAAQDITKRRQAEEELEGYRDHLEELVKERTFELEQANEQLQQEIAERIQAEEGQRQALAETLQATRALQESEERYQSLFDHVLLGLYRTTPQGKILDVNPAMAQMLGHSEPEAMLATNARDFYMNLEDRRRWQTVMEAKGVVRDFEVQLRRNDGAVIWVWDNAWAVRDGEGQILYYEGSLEDITKRKQMEMNIRHRNERLNFLNTISAAAVSSLDPDVVMHQILDLTCQTLDADGGSILLSKPRTGGLFFAVVAGGDVNALRGASLAPGQGIGGWVAQHRQSALVNDVRHDPRWHDGIDRSIGFRTRSLICTPLVYREQVTGVIEIVNKHTDEFTKDDLSLLEAVASITASALENARLYMTTRARAEELALLHEMGLALISTLDPATVIHVALNQIMRLFQAERVSLFEPDRQTGEMCFVKALFKPKLVEKLVSGALENDVVEQSIEHGPILIEDVQNDPRFADRLDQHMDYQARTLMAAPLKTLGDAAGAIVVVSSEPGIYTREELYILQTIVSTLTVALQNARLYDRLKVLLEERERTQAHLIQTEKLTALGRLAASLAHEINNPLQALRSGFRLLATRQPTEEKRRIYLDLISQEVERLVGIVERVLGFYRPSGREPVSTDINTALDETLLLVGKQLERGRVTVHRQLNAGLPPVKAMADQLKQVFLNVILNALHAMPEGGELTVVTDWDARMGEVHIAFTDTGVGIPDDQIPRLFEPLFTARPDGTGLGLTISYSIVERHGGYIKVESEVGRGSTFTVVLPVGGGPKTK